MAAIRQQGVYLSEFLVGFTVFPAGLVMVSTGGGALGYVVTIAGLAVLLHACFGFYKIKKLEFTGGS